ncbi:MAG: hypothetical protein R2883_03665 [Caldisericia bacterium]
MLCQGTPISLNIHFRSEIPLPSGVKFKVIQAPPDTVYSFTPETLGSSGVTSLFLNAGPGCPEGTHTIIIQAEGAGFRRATTFTVTVRKESPGDFTFIAEPAKIQIYAGEPAEVDFTIDAVGGFVGVVQLSVDGLPTGVLGSFSPIITTVPGKSKYKMKVAKNLAPGTYNLVFKAEGGCKTKTFPVVLEVEAPVPGDYKTYLVDKNDKDQVVWLGEEITIEIGVEFLDGYNLPVTFEVLNLSDFDPTTEFEFVPKVATETTTVTLKITTKFTGREIDGKRVIIRTTSGRKAPKTQVQFFLTVKKTEGGFTIKPLSANILQLTAGQYGLIVFEYKNTTKFYTTTKFHLEFDGCEGIEFWFYPEKLSPSVHQQKVVALFKVPRTLLDNDAEALAAGYKECSVSCFGIGGGLRVGSRPINLRIYDPGQSMQRAYFFPDFKGLKNKSVDEIEIHFANLDSVKSISFDILYNPLEIEIIDPPTGCPVMESDGKPVPLVTSLSPDVGVYNISATRGQDDGPISGSGKFCTIKIRGTIVTQETTMKICNLRVLDEFNGYKPITGPLPDTPPILRLTTASHLPGDVNGDNKVDDADLVLLTEMFGCQAGVDNCYNPSGDFNEDGIIDGMDLIILCMNWGATIGDEGPVP